MTRRGHGRAEDQWQPTEMVAHCQCCGVQWQVVDPNFGDARSCPWCGAGERAVTVVSEAPSDYGAVIAGPR